MATNVTLDTNVVFDLLLAREPYVQDTLLLFAMGEAGDLELYLSADAISTLFYVVERNTTAATARYAITGILDRVHLIPLLEETIRNGLAYDFVDVEDALVASAASSVKNEFIITRNIKDFANSPIPAITPREFIAYWQSLRKPHSS